MHQPPKTDQREEAGPPARGRGRERIGFGILIAATTILYVARLGAIDLWTPDEPRYAAIAEELRSFRHGARGLVLLHQNDAAYTQKPPLYFWLAALAGAPGGRVDALAARLPSALAGIAAVALTAWIGRRLLARPWTPLLAAGMLATSSRFAFTARRAQLDVLLTLFELVAVALFWRLETKQGGIEAARRFPAEIACLHASLGAAALVKGPVGWLPLAVFAAYLAWEGRLRAFRQIVPWWAWGLSVAPLASWAAGAVVLAPPGFAEAAIGENLVGRFFAGTSHARPVTYYLYQLPIDFLPWTLLLPAALPVVWRSARDRAAGPGAPLSPAAARLLICWIALPLLFFSLSAGKRGVYLLPIFPALALVGTLGLERWTRSAERSAPLRACGIALLVVVLLEAIVAFGVFPYLDPQKSLRPIARAAAEHVPPHESVGVYGLSSLEGALGYYEGLRVVSLRTPEALADFLAADGRLVLLRERHLDGFAADLGLEVVDGARFDRRRLVLATSSRAGSQGVSE